MLSLRQVTLEAAHYRWYGAKVWSPLLQDISLDIAPGEMVALVGGSGEGKSLLLQCLLGLLPENLHFRGNISLDGKIIDNNAISQLRGTDFCYLPQGVQALNPVLDIKKHLKRACQLSGREWDENQIAHLLQKNQLSAAVLNNFPRQLSGGMAKRVLACHASLSHARYILADEITVWLDMPLATQLLNHLRSLCEQGRGILWVTHDLMLAAQHADRIVSLHQGRISDNLSKEQLIHGEMSEQLKRQWQALPERNLLFV
ncbi:ATP-binding cassette domain-containing protein [Pectobacterium versatile]|uniref:ATP-binding cassette domain-containing protein n=1 Tax=Pectobacterium versatile TaxID=2488639 RepID=A0ABU8JTY3_9GAMM|nr:ATP-binding cassette domain-containing protein [Pectobacterium versatile]GKX36478.1 ABC transporter ATP-binding protein [Pectobacterium carotovorum subsp. carotovorum]MBA0161587.1 ATP-binding cassette domain-containing protein [Pectobacterium versatile]MBN3058758.1 ATP-binding cassette domain-containing protein [Pectobacterium versatile]MBQ4776113.1 ATP-binding cassette domain-containing protein [Pectobacterium versatile]MBQ4779830.1 ATP-binding cassette domain-containing protein [Pectobact